MFQDSGLLPHKNVLNNISLAPAKVRKMATRLVNCRVGLENKESTLPNQLKLDTEMLKKVLDVMLGFAKGGITMIVASHEMGFARAATDRVVCIDNGKMLSWMNPNDTNPKKSRTKEFLKHIL
ncbi:hypothetical protein S1OALGB6SA_1212 [Olavius algarvensis spirochete endosymbiont]|nr:hypothetical protein S1OALGB6SA_1212 [Olavius algarvensis spirochete endosymbiont]